MGVRARYCVAARLCRGFVRSWPRFPGCGLGFWQPVIRLRKGGHLRCRLTGFGRGFLGVGLLFCRRGRGRLRGCIAATSFGRTGANHTAGGRGLGKNHFHRGRLAGLGRACLSVVRCLIKECRQKQKMRKGRGRKHRPQCGVGVYVLADQGCGGAAYRAARWLGHGHEREQPRPLPCTAFHFSRWGGGKGACGLQAGFLPVG